MSQYNAALVADMVATGDPASRESNEQLYPRVAAGDKAAIRQMIEGNMSLVVDKVDSFIVCFPKIAHLRDDMISGGFIGLTEAVNRMAETGPKDSPNPTGYISFWVKKHIGLVVDGEQANGASSWTIADRKNKGKELSHQVPMPNVEQFIDPTAMVELRDLIQACCETEEDRVIVEMREKGYVDKDIAETLGLPLTTTYMMRRAIYERFLEKSGLKGEV